MKRLAEAGAAQLIVVNDDHRLDTIRDSGVLADALEAVGISRRSDRNELA